MREVHLQPVFAAAWRVRIPFKRRRHCGARWYEQWKTDAHCALNKTGNPTT